jgi:hypothetical protein
MTLAILFWVLMIVWAVFGAWSSYVPGQSYTYRHWGGTVLTFILLAILGWAQFGAPIH